MLGTIYAFGRHRGVSSASCPVCWTKIRSVRESPQASSGDQCESRQSESRGGTSLSTPAAKIVRTPTSLATSTAEPNRWFAHRQYHQSGCSDDKKRYHTR